MVKTIAAACSAAVGLRPATLPPAQQPSPYGAPILKAKGEGGVARAKKEAREAAGT